MDETTETQVGFISLHEDMYFTCSSGLAPAKIISTQRVAKTKDGFHYLVKDDTACNGAGDFMCRWTVVIAATIAALGVVTGGAALAALAVIAVGTSALLCGGVMAPHRKWIGYSELNAYGRKDAYSLTSKCQMTCPIGGVVTYAPGITGFWSALLYTARNTAWAVFEGMIWGKLGGAGGASLTGLFTTQALKNFLFLQAAARAAGVVDQVLFEGMLRNGKDLSDTGEEAIAGATMFEQPFINFWNRVTDENDDNTGAILTDLYYMGLSLAGMKLMADAASTNKNIPAEAFKAAKNAAVKIKGILFERTTFLKRLKAYKKYSPNWKSGSLSATLDKFAPGVKGELSSDGVKTRYYNQASNIEIILDNENNYFRIYDHNRNQYLNPEGTVPNTGHLMGQDAKNYNQAQTHILNSDVVEINTRPIDDNDDD